MKYIFILLVIITFGYSSSWQLKEKKDVMTDNIQKIATIVNRQGYELKIYKPNDLEQIWANFYIPPNILDTIEPSKALVYRVDKNKAENLQWLVDYGKTMGKETYIWEPKWINFLLMFRIPKEGISKESPIAQIINGNKLIVRYHLSTGGYKDIEFSLKNSNHIIKQAINIKKWKYED